MVTCGQRKMMSMAPASAIAVPSSPSSTKPKIGFSIDSIVGSAALQNHAFDTSLSPRSESSERPSSPHSECGYPLELRQSNDFSRNFRFPSERFQSDSDFRIRLPPKYARNFDNNDSSSANRDHSPPPSSFHSRLSPAKDYVGRLPTRSPSPRVDHSPHAAAQQSSNKGPIVVPGIPAGLIRPHPVQPPSVGDLKSASHFLNSPGQPNAHYLAAQFQMAAVLAHGQTGQGFPPNMGLHPMAHHPQFAGGPNVIRDSYPLYPWLLSRHGRIFPHRFPGNFLLQPFRKPKRVRTAFSPTQLLKLEHAFEGNHYVVGAERKTLAQALSLTETQVKVWFQNRRTKHKRMQQEENSKGSGGANTNDSLDGKHDAERNDTPTSYDEDDIEDDELIDMDDCSSDQEGGDFDP